VSERLLEVLVMGIKWENALPGWAPSTGFVYIACFVHPINQGL